MKRQREPRRSLAEKVFVTLVGFICVAHTGVLPHRPQAAAVHRCLHAAGIRKLSWITEVVLVVEPVQVGGRVEGVYIHLRGGLDIFVFSALGCRFYFRVGHEWPLFLLASSGKDGTCSRLP